MLTLDGDTVRSRVERTSAIPAIPQVMKKILRAVEDPATSPALVSKLVASDPGLTAKILRVINAAVYGFVARIASVNQAIVLLGLDVVRALLLGVSIFEMMEQTAVGLWKHSLGCAIAAKLLAQKRSAAEPEEASIAGLLHDIGKVVLHVQFPAEYQMALAAARDRGLFLVDAEKERFAMTHATAGAYFASAWRLPKFVVESIRYHHRPSLAKVAPIYTLTVHMADILAKAYSVGFSGDAFVSPVHQAAWELFHFSEAEMKDIFARMGDMIAEVDDFLNNPEG